MGRQTRFRVKHEISPEKLAFYEDPVRKNRGVLTDQQLEDLQKKVGGPSHRSTELNTSNEKRELPIEIGQRVLGEYAGDASRLSDSGIDQQTAA